MVVVFRVSLVGERDDAIANGDDELGNGFNRTNGGDNKVVRLESVCSRFFELEHWNCCVSFLLLVSIGIVLVAMDMCVCLFVCLFVCVWVRTRSSVMLVGSRGFVLIFELIILLFCCCCCFWFYLVFLFFIH